MQADPHCKRVKSSQDGRKVSKDLKSKFQQWISSAKKRNKRSRKDKNTTEGTERENLKESVPVKVAALVEIFEGRNSKAGGMTAYY